MFKKSKTLGYFDELKLGKIDPNEPIHNVEEIKESLKCPTCGKEDTLSKVLPVVELAGRTLHECSECRERCYK